jgi:hypothetical protein
LTGVWRCTQAGLTTSKPTIRTKALRDRPYKASTCPEGAYSDTEGVCHACGTVATPASIAAGAPDSGPFVDGVENDDVELYAVVFDTAVSGRSAPVCIPEVCCIVDTGEYTGNDEVLHGDDAIAPEDNADSSTIEYVTDDGSDNSEDATIVDDSVSGDIADSDDDATTDSVDVPEDKPESSDNGAPK